jgi:hypothetical protein
MSKEIKQGTRYWFTEHGEWGTVDVEHVYFSDEHHANIHESFDMVSDWHYPNWAHYLAQRPHPLADNGFGCITCEELATAYRLGWDK